MFDVFYLDDVKPNLFAHERHADSIEHARQMSTTRFFWIVSYLCDYRSWDFLWEPVPWQQHQRHAWRSQWQKDSGTYLVPRSGYQDTNYHSDRSIVRLESARCWQSINELAWDCSWHPDPTDPPYIYQFGTQHQRTGGPRYVVPGAREIKYVSTPRAARVAVDQMWEIPEGIDPDFDWTWHPDDRDPPYIYQFGTQHQRTGGPRYMVPGATEVKYVSTPRATRITVDACWTVPENTNREAFDWTWHPDDRDPPYIYQFGTQWNRAGGPVYTVPGATEVKYATAQTAKMLPSTNHWTIPPEIDVNSFDFSWTPDPTEPPYIYQFGTQWQKTGGPRYEVPGAEEVKYIANPRAKKIQIDTNWEMPQGTEFDKEFDWTWHPNDTESPYIYQFGTQHQRTGGPRYIVPGATEVKYVDQVRVNVKNLHVPVFVIDHLDGNVDRVREEIGNKAKVIKSVRFVDNYLDTLRRIAAVADPDIEYAWICSSICDYTNHDFTWHPEQWQATMLHVFGSNDQKFGDTFLVHLPSFKTRSVQCELLEWYDCNFITDRTLPRRPLPVITHQFDSQAQAIQQLDWSGPLALLCAAVASPESYPTVPVWRAKTRAITCLDSSGSAVIVPRDAKVVVQSQVYDYPEITKSSELATTPPLDIVFISNGESTAEKAWTRLNESLTFQPNNLHRIHGVNGRVAAYHAAAEVSTTPWFFAVFAKLFVADFFDWSWQPDRMQQPKHYIFHARNPVNGLEYGHQAMIAYNKKLVLSNPGRGLDFTLDDTHEVVPILSGIAFYADTPWMAWRTAFRECIKLQHSLPDVENQYRLEQWLKPSPVRNGQWSQWGAEDAVEYYHNVDGKLEELRRSYEWEWLATYAFVKRKLAPD